MDLDTSEPGVQPARFPVVGIGASAGGLEALQKLLGRLNGDGMAFVVVQHLAAGRESALSEILARSTEVPVMVIQEAQTIEVNRIYVAPPDTDVRIEGNQLRLEAIRSHEVPRRTIDTFLRSLALDRGRAAIGLVLSGTGSDGTLGLRSIKEAGGITFVQDPATAAQPGMPQSAIEAGVADFCLSPMEIGEELTRLGTHPYVARDAQGIDDQTLAAIFELLQKAFGVDFATYKRGTVERRIQRRMALAKIDSLPEYYEYLEKNPQEAALLYGDLLIGVTAFFRDRGLFASLQSSILPRLMNNRQPGAPIRVWVAGCASGEEAYSLAIAIFEYLGDGAADQRVQVFATDIDEQALLKARHAIYPRSIEGDLSPERLRRFFVHQDQGYRLSRIIRDAVVFARHNLGKDPPFSHLDLVSCRNVLIYMQPALQRRILRVLHYSLKEGGILMLGLSESLGEATDLFETIDPQLRIYAKQSAVPSRPAELGFAPHGGAEEPGIVLQTRRPFVATERAADRRLLELYAPPGVLVNELLDVLQFRGRTGPFLEPSPGAATLNILKLIRTELLPTLRATLHGVVQTGQSASSAMVPLVAGSENLLVSIDVVPLSTEIVGEVYFLILFKEHVPPSPLQVVREVGASAGVEALERELDATRQSLQTTIEELEASNEELQSANEELQSANEELQSTNEELETSKEELESTNEELATVNDELQSRMALLSVTGDDLKNILLNMTTSLLLVGNDLRIRGFSAAAERLLNLLPTDVGRPVAYLRTIMMARELEQMVKQVIEAMTGREQRVRATDGYWYTMRILPYKTSDSAIRGALIEFVRAPATTRVQMPGDLGDLATELLASLPQALMMLDDRLRVFWANRAFFEMFKIEGDVFGRPLEELWDGRNREPELWTRLEEIAGGGPIFSDFLIDHPLTADAPPMSVSARKLPTSSDRPPLTLVILQPAQRGHDA